ncbi:MAG: Ig domain protein group 1 domain protein [Chloroflexi bacterium]|nr:Ig domain protein group 1 domain protein [Chloroflexota bacterium]
MMSRAGRHSRAIRLAVATTVIAILALTPTSGSADTVGGQASSYLAHRQSINLCSGWMPDFFQQLTRTRQPAFNASTTAATLLALTAGQTYTVRVRAAGPTGEVALANLAAPGVTGGSTVTVKATPTGTITITWGQSAGATSFVFEVSTQGAQGPFVTAQARPVETVTGSSSFVLLGNPTSSALRFQLKLAPADGSPASSPSVTVPANGTLAAGAWAPQLNGPSLPTDTNLSLPDQFKGTITGVACPREMSATIGSVTVAFDEKTGPATFSSSTFVPTPGCNLWSPLFTNENEGWTSSLALRNQTNDAVDVDIRLRPLGGGAPIDRSLKMPSRATRELKPSDLGAPSGFIGSFGISSCAKPGGRSVAGELSGVVSHDKTGVNRLAVPGLSTENLSILNESKMNIALAFNDYQGWTSRVIVQNTDANLDSVVRIFYKGAAGEAVEQVLTIPSESAVALDFEKAQAPKGVLSIQIEPRGTVGAGILASAYHFGPEGIADAANGDVSGSTKVFLPLLFRKYNGYDSGIRVLQASPGASTPRIAFTDQASGEVVLRTTAPAAIQEGQATTWYLPSVDGLVDNKVYSAVIEVDSGSIVALGNHVSYARDTAMLYNGVGLRVDEPAQFRVRDLAAQIVYRAVEGLNSGIQIQNLSGSDSSVTVRFRNTVGTVVATRTVSVVGNSSVTVYLPEVPDLPDGFVGSAEITGTVPLAATVNTVRYTSPTAAQPSAPAPTGT